MDVLLLSDPSPCLRSLVLTELLERPPQDPEVQELAELRHADDLVTELVALQHPDGHWDRGDGAWRVPQHPARMTGLALHRLGSLGLGPGFEPVRRGAEFLWRLQEPDGSWSLDTTNDDDPDEGGLTNSPMQTALPLRGLVRCGYAEDARSERAYEWLLKERLDDGAWPTGYADGNLRRVAGYRRLAHSQWGCRTSTTAVVQCLAEHPTLSQSTEARRGLDLLLGRETRDAYAFGFETARMLGAEPAAGLISFFARFDAGLLLDLAWRVGADSDDPRIADTIDFALSLQGEYGLWEYQPQPQCSRWVTFETLRSLSRLNRETDWMSSEPRTPFQPYPVKRKRY